jgi:glycosyltransferase involved in cell wall biosynthesis
MISPNNTSTAASYPTFAVERTILMVGNFFASSVGSMAVCEELATRLSAAGWSVITTSQQLKRLARLMDMVGTVWRRRHSYRLANVEVYTGPAFVWAEVVCWALRKARKPYVLTLHSGDMPIFSQQWPGRVTRLLESAAAVTAPSRYLLEQMRVYRRDLCLLPNALDLDAYLFRVRRRPRPHLIWLRAFHEIYNPSLAPKVVARLAADFPDLHLTMVGPDKGDGSLQRVKETSMALGTTNRITLSGGVPKAEVPAWLDRGDLFLNTTNVDNTPVSVLEAMACGLPIVSTNVGGVPYLLEHEHDAMLVPAEDPNAMAVAVQRILSEPLLAERLSASARASVKRFDWSVVLPQWERLLMNAAGQSRT